VRSGRHVLDWPNQPLPFKIYTSLAPLALPLTFGPSEVPALQAIGGVCPSADRQPDLPMLARLCYFSNGITRVLRRMPFRAAACTGALFHIELYPICGDLPGLDAGVYHFGAHDNALRRLRGGDHRVVLVSATGGEPHIAAAPAVFAFTSTWWRNAWKYQARAYRHAFWDTGTIVANLLAVACANGVASHVVVGFADAEVNRLLDVDPGQEAAICLVALGSGSAAPPDGDVMSVVPLGLPTRPLSAKQVDYPLIVEAHRASSLGSGDDVVAWRAAGRSLSPSRVRPSCSDGLGPVLPADLSEAGPRRADSIESVILRRGSSRRFSHDPVTVRELELMLEAATASLPSDAPPALTQPYLIVNAVEGLDPGAYVLDRASGRLERLKSGDFRREAAFLDLGQELAGDAAVNVYWLGAFERDRDYRAAQLEAAIEGGKLYLAAYALGLGATGLTFFDDDVIRFFSPHAAGKAVMFLTAVGHPARRRALI
jgi:SagB-type dehydrogenase family enzyme